ncbi:MAG: T9SS type A sorting domain-containing protein [candidate division SR1 bacterium]|nr:T9SS type A sorting domain-containing protein [candidate division SR1 bacterium]
MKNMLNLKRSPSSWKLNSEAATSSPWKKLIVTLLFLGTVMLYAQAPSIEWQKSLGSTALENAFCIQQTSDGGYIVVGNSSNTADGYVTMRHGGSDYWIVRLTSLGDTLWQKSYGGSNNEVANAVQQTSDGGYIVAGWSNSNNFNVSTPRPGAEDYWIVKLDPSGTILWEKSLGGTNNERATAIQQTSDGGYIVAGYSLSNDVNVSGHIGSEDYWIVKLSSLGIIQYQRSMGGTSSDKATSIQQTSDGGYIVAGWSSSTDINITAHHGTSLEDYWIVKLNPSLDTIQHQRSIGGTGSDNAYFIQQTSDGGYIVAGSSNSDSILSDRKHPIPSGGTDYWVVKLNPSLDTIQWEKSLGGSGSDNARSIKQTSDGGYILVGYSASIDSIVGNRKHPIPSGGTDYWVIKLDNAGIIQWEKSLGGTSSDQALSGQETSDGGYIIAGHSASSGGQVSGHHGTSGGTSFDFWIVKLYFPTDPLPISLLSFTGSCEAGTIVLKWSTATETNNDYFSIEKSTDAIHWQLVKKVQGAGNSSWTNNYELSLEESHGIKYYRLKQTDYNGHEELFPLIVVECASNASYSVWPNPFSDELNVESSEEIGIIITDVVGRTVFQTTSIGHNLLHPELSSGIYFLSILAQDGNQTIIKIIVKGWPLVFERLFLYRKFQEKITRNKFIS